MQFRGAKISGKLRALRINLLFVAIALATWTSLNRWIVRTYHVPSWSMAPTLLEGDVIVVNRLTYGRSLFRRAQSRPRRNDVIVFTSRGRLSHSQNSQPLISMVKRIVGVPGDTVMMRAGRLIVNGRPQPSPTIPPDRRALSDNSSMDFGWQASAEVAHSRFGEPPVNRSLDDWGPLAVPADKYFTLGDDRLGSVDSRDWGFVSRNSIIGRAFLIVYSFVPADRSLRTMSTITDVRWSRIGQSVE
jgi:signal peptidase I